MKSRKMRNRFGVVVLLVVLCAGMMPAQAKMKEPDAEIQWTLLRTCVLDCTISESGIASIYSNATTKKVNQKVKVTATLSEFDPYTNEWIDYCSISYTNYGNALVETNYMIPAHEGIYFNRTTVKTYDENGNLVETIKLETEPEYYPGR